MRSLNRTVLSRSWQAWIFLVGMRLVGIKQYYIRDQVRSSKPAGPLVSTKADKWLYTAPCKIHGTVYRILLHMHLKLRQVIRRTQLSMLLLGSLELDK